MSLFSLFSNEFLKDADDNIGKEHFLYKLIIDKRVKCSFPNIEIHTCQPREKFWRDKRGATERSEPTSEGGSGGPGPENFKNLHGKWCNLRYS